ncbi:hypothetical protein SporoP37_01505 [Sporosarcina sp. P37]|uniref:hypothetical protein n=1 Tax=unclassified Sporosarcina TaxID=2647733 RepID=UPI000A17C9D9|nr:MULTISPECIES: hypothetical protein [unclassified Sporosarcina]ARK23500.1 hypothetical protein SporoP37_01505 [Sporosarcina sp. P37]PID17655.1 hypothetical protein CSV62_12260 [Sporosarcina sp. P35]
MRKFFYYFGWTIVLGIIIYASAQYQMVLKQEYMKNYNPSSFVLFSAIFPILIGILLRLPKLIQEIKVSKQWTFNWAKFIGAGLPSLCILALPVFVLSPFGVNFLPLLPELMYAGNSTIQTIAGLVFGFIFLDSVKIA